MKNTKSKRLFLVEFYTKSDEGVPGWEINNAWVFALNSADARNKLARRQGSRFDCVITCSEQAEIVPLAGDYRVNTKDANLFILN